MEFLFSKVRIIFNRIFSGEKIFVFLNGDYHFIFSGSKDLNLKNEEINSVYTSKTVAGMEEVLKKELDFLGAVNTQILKRAVSFEGNKTLL